MRPLRGSSLPCWKKVQGGFRKEVRVGRELSSGKIYWLSPFPPSRLCKNPAADAEKTAKNDHEKKKNRTGRGKTRPVPEKKKPRRARTASHLGEEKGPSFLGRKGGVVSLGSDPVRESFLEKGSFFFRRGPALRPEEES